MAFPSTNSLFSVRKHPYALQIDFKRNDGEKDFRFNTEGRHCWNMLWFEKCKKKKSLMTLENIYSSTNLL